MKTIIFLLLLIPAIISTGPVTPDCKCKDIPLFGDVMIKKSFADFKVRITTGNPDLYVDTTSIRQSQCGEWHFVTTGNPDFTIEFVNSFEDFTIQYSSFPAFT
ncbi:MAG: hypothetical protein R2764_01580 [Bacteroidales bacterium]